jgi:hypothetical protein
MVTVTRAVPNAVLSSSKAPQASDFASSRSSGRCSVTRGSLKASAIVDGIHLAASLGRKELLRSEAAECRSYNCAPDRSERASNVTLKIRVDVEASAGVGW